MKRNFFWILFISALIIFRGIFVGSIYWGDSPHFFPEEISQFQIEPVAWTSLSSNFGGINLPLWLAPVMFLWKWISPQMLFIIPSIVLSVIGPIFLTRYLKLGKSVQFFSSAVYTFNTYYLLLIDGGQLGVALSYGLFPITILFLKKLIDEPKFKNFYLALIALTLNGLADPRIAMIAVVTVMVWNIARAKNLLSFVPLGISWFLLNAFWIVPLVKNKNALSSLGQLDIVPVKLFNPLMLFSSHWPDNLFGKINPLPLYFIGIPVLIFLGFYISRKRRDLTYLGCYILFSVLSVIPIGVVFRDSTKFYIPVILFAGILIGRAVEVLRKPWLGIIVFLYIVFLVHPAIFGKMNFVLSNRTHSDDYFKIYNNLRNDDGFFRTVWFPERHPLSFGTEDKPVIDGKELVKFPPFANYNVGEDPFNFLNNPNFVESLRTLGVKYLIFSGNPREISKTEKEQENWEDLISVVNETPGLEKVDWDVKIPVYKISDSYPHIFSVKKLVAVIGPKLSAKYPAIYFEDGKLDPRLLEKIDPKSVVIFFNGKGKTDLAMSFLQKYFYFPGNASTSQWAVYTNKEYLKYKYQLLVRGVNFNDLDYGGGVGFSTQNGEEIDFKFKVPEDGNYMVAVRSMVPEDGEKSLIWKLEEPRFFPKGSFTYAVKNETGMKILNAVALIPQSAFKEAESLAGTYLESFSLVESGGLNDLTKYDPVDFSSVPANSWMIFTDNYHPMWKLKKDGHYSSSLPVYSMVNGFFVDGASSDLSIEFSGQKNFRIGLFISLISLATLAISGVLASKSLKSN